MKKIISKLSIFAFLFGCANFASAEYVRISLNKRNVYQSEVLLIQMISKSTAPFTVNFLGKKYGSFLMGEYQTALVGIDYQLKPGTYTLAVIYQIRPKFYLPARYLVRVKEKFPILKYSLPKRPKEEQERISGENEKIQEILNKPSKKLIYLKPFVWPVKPIKVNSEFGKLRCRDRIRNKKFNCRYHLGTDYRAAFDEDHSKPVGISAINKGRVVLTSDYLMDGKIIVIDHGNGISSGYLHLSKFLVNEGDWVKAGQKIAVAGKTGATEAVHLHLFIKMDNGKTLIDPHNFLQMIVK